MNEHRGRGLSSGTWVSHPSALPQGADTAAGRGFPRVGRLLVSPAEAAKGSNQGLRHKNSTQCRDGKTEAAWGLVQDPMVRQPKTQ